MTLLRSLDASQTSAHFISTIVTIETVCLHC